MIKVSSCEVWIEALLLLLVGRTSLHEAMRNEDWGPPPVVVLLPMRPLTLLELVVLQPKVLLHTIMHHSHCRLAVTATRNGEETRSLPISRRTKGPRGKGGDPAPSQ